MGSALESVFLRVARIYPTRTAPPFTLKTSPVMKPACAVHKKRTGAAISSGLPTRPSGIVRRICSPLLLDETKDSVEIDRHCRAPLFIRHALNRDIFDGPHAVIRNQNVESSKPLNGLGDKGPGSLRIVKIRRNRETDLGTTLLGQGVSLRARTSIAEGNFRVGCGEHADRGGPDAARTTRNESNFTGE